MASVTTLHASAVALALTIDAETYSEIVDFVEERGLLSCSCRDSFNSKAWKEIEEAAIAANCTPQMMVHLLIAIKQNYQIQK